MHEHFKFRVYDKDTKSIRLSPDGAKEKQHLGSWFNANCNTALDNNSKIVYMQFSGLKDSKGIDIYEKDIVYVAGYGDMVIEFPFIELYEAQMENDIGEIKGNIFI